MVEAWCEFTCELSVIVARSSAGETRAFPVAENIHTQHILDFSIVPARVTAEVAVRAATMAEQIAEKLGVVGLLAVELFLTTAGELVVNELAPRPHNSGHHTIESSHVSQYEQHLRSILGLPLGSTAIKQPAVMLNLLGEPGHTGPVRYAGLSEVLAMPGTSLHLYGKRETRPFRKMGHLTVCAPTIEAAVALAREVEGRVKCEAEKG